MQKLRSALIGLGARTNKYYVNEIGNSQLSELVAICDVDHHKVKDYEKEFSVQGYQDYQDLINQENIDLLITVVPHNQYRYIIDYAAQKGINILKEKPFAMNLSEAFYLTQVCQNYNIKLMTTLQRRFNPVYQKYFDFVDKIGQPFYIEGKYTFFIDNLAEGWRANKNSSDGGCILDMGYHLIDLIIWYFGLPDLVHAEFSNSALGTNNYDVEDTATILFKYESGLHGNLTLSRYLPPKSESLHIRGTKGSICINRHEIQLLNRQGEFIDSFKSNQYFANQIDYFCQVIAGEKNNFGSPEYHLQHLQFIQACYISKIKQSYVSPREVNYV